VFEITCVLLLAWQSPLTAKQPEDVMQEFRVMERSGGRLTPQGWKASEKFFLHFHEYPQKLSLMVVTGTERVYRDDVYFKLPGQVSIHVKYRTLGQIDCRGRFVSVVWPVFTDKNGKTVEELSPPFIPGGGGADVEFVLEWTNADGIGQWRIKNFLHQPEVSIDTAILYLGELGKKSIDKAVRANSKRSIQLLEKLKKN
jgi:hypothetical protein